MPGCNKPSIIKHYSFLQQRAKQILSVIDLIEPEKYYVIIKEEILVTLRYYTKENVIFHVLAGNVTFDNKNLFRHLVSMGAELQSFSHQESGSLCFDYSTLFENIKEIPITDLPLWIGSEYISPKFEEILKTIKVKPLKGDHTNGNRPCSYQ